MGISYIVRSVVTMMVLPEDTPDGVFSREYDDELDLYTEHIDPDVNFFNELDNKNECRYYLQDDLNQCMESNRNLNGFSLLSFNIRSTPKNFDAFSAYMDTLCFSFSVIGLVEIWHTRESVDILNLSGYRSVHSYRADRRGGGLSLYIDQNMNYTVRTDLNINNDILEYIFVELADKPAKN